MHGGDRHPGPTEWVSAASPGSSRTPLAALAGVLLATTARMVEVGSLRALLRSTRRDAADLVVTFAVTVAIDLVTAVIVGLAVPCCWPCTGRPETSEIADVRVVILRMSRVSSIVVSATHPGPA